MSIVSVCEDWRGRSTEVDGYAVRHVRMFKVQTSDKSEGSVDVVDATDGVTAIPAIGAAHPDDVNSYVRKKVAEPDQDSHVFWRVRVEYDNANPIPTSDPTSEDPVISYSWNVVNVPFDKAYELPTLPSVKTKPVVNTIGDEFNPPHMVEQYRMLTRISRKESSFSPTTAFLYQDSVNHAAITIASFNYPQYTARMREFSGTKSFDATGTAYWDVVYAIEYNPVGWDILIRDAGLFCWKNGVAGDRTRIVIDAVPTPTGYPLKANGDYMPYGDPDWPGRFLTFVNNFPQDWSTLSLPAAN